MVPKYFIAGLALTIVALRPLPAAEHATTAELAAANALRDAGKYAEARVAFEKILAHVPDDPEANYSVGLFACDAGDWEKALRCEGKAVTSDPNSARYQYGWGSANGIAAMKAGIFSKLGHAKKCLAAYVRAVELEPHNLQYRRAAMSYYQQAPGFAGGDIEKAYAQAAAIKAFDPEHGRQAFADLYLGEKKIDLAFHEFDEALRQDPNDYPALYQIGRLAGITGVRQDDGIAALKHCLELTPPARADMPKHDNVQWRLGILWEKKGDPVQARAAYVAALAINPDFRRAKDALAQLDARSSKNPKGDRVASNAVRTNEPGQAAPR
jgi:tetratricopeptide (TPR) repeat protein